MKKENRGITLIALVITIIVLLILAGVTISLTLGEQGIIRRAQQATEEYSKAEVKERVQLEIFASLKEDVNMETLKQNIEDNLGVSGGDITDTQDGGIEFPLSGYVVEVDKDGNVIIKDEKGTTTPTPEVAKNPDGIKWIYEVIEEPKISSINKVSFNKGIRIADNTQEKIRITGLDLSEYDCVGTPPETGDLYATEYASITLDFDTLIIPDTIDGKKVVEFRWNSKIKNAIYKGSEHKETVDGLTIYGIKKLIFGDNIEYIGCKAARSTNIDPISFPDVETIQLPKNLKYLQFAFPSCSTLESVVLPEGLEWMGSAFYKCSSLQTINIPNTVTEIDHATFFGCDSLTNVNIPKSVSSIGGRCKENCELESKQRDKVFSSNTTVNFPEGKNETLEIPADKWGAGKITIQGAEWKPEE